MKPSTAVTELEQGVTVPETGCHYEAELAYLKSIGKEAAAENVIRYRVKKDPFGEAIIDSETNEPELESNAAFIERNDGTVQLYIGQEVFDVIENTPELLKTIKGVGEKRVESITKNWSEQKIVRQIMVFLQSHGVGTAKATRIYKTYREDAIKVVLDNPYKLAKDIKGIGFISADKIANNLGIAENSIIRARAGVGHILMEALSDGHIALPVNLLINNT